ncbi:MAG: enoyl-CoA hydratase/isomerase family protein [Elusimicrobiota bacterium]|nr:enoyl-CoA hydratase/isomerase family protein [Elusimicrobiota bacterium]
MTGAVSARDEGNVRVVTLTRAPGNTLGVAVLAELRAEIDRAGRDPKVRALVLASGLPKYFSSGLDLMEIMSLPEGERPQAFEGLLDCYRALLGAPKPVVGALSGAAILGGWIIAMGCDWRIMASESGKAALSEIRLGLTPTPALVERLSALASDQRVVKEMVLRGKTLRAAEALVAGLVDELAPETEVFERSLALAKRLAKSAPAAFASLKRGLNAPFLSEDLWARSMSEFNGLIAGAEAREGMAAMRDKRRPRWEE